MAKAGNEDFEVIEYEGVGHAFMNDLPAPYDDWESREKTQGFPPRNDAPVKLGWNRVIAFFDKHLK